MRFWQLCALVFTLLISVNAQIDCVVQNKIVVNDYDGIIIKNVTLEIYKIEEGNKKTFAFSPQKVEDNFYYFISTLGSFKSSGGTFFYVSDNYWLKVTAENFKVHEQPIRFERCKARQLTVTLERINQKIKLTGVVYDEQGSLVPGVKVKAVNKKGESYETETNGDGIYLLNLLPDYYAVEFQQSGFRKLILQDFHVVNSTYGKINRDVTLNVDNSNCGVGGCLPAPDEIELPELKVSKEILQRPLEELPEAENKTKRKKKNK